MVLGISVSSCITMGENFSSDVSWIEKNKTTKAQVQRSFGEPAQTGNSTGKQTWTYTYYKLRLFGAKEIKELKLYWDQGRVSSYSFTSSFKEDRQRALSTPKH